MHCVVTEVTYRLYFPSSMSVTPPSVCPGPRKLDIRGSSDLAVSRKVDGSCLQSGRETDALFAVSCRVDGFQVCGFHVCVSVRVIVSDGDGKSGMKVSAKPRMGRTDSKDSG